MSSFPSSSSSSSSFRRSPLHRLAFETVPKFTSTRRKIIHPDLNESRRERSTSAVPVPRIRSGRIGLPHLARTPSPQLRETSSAVTSNPSEIEEHTVSLSVHGNQSPVSGISSPLPTEHDIRFRYINFKESVLSENLLDLKVAERMLLSPSEFMELDTFWNQEASNILSSIRLLQRCASIPSRSTPSTFVGADSVLDRFGALARWVSSLLQSCHIRILAQKKEHERLLQQHRELICRLEASQNTAPSASNSREHQKMYLEGQLSMLHSLTLPLALFTFCCYRHPILKAAQGIIHRHTKSERDACLNKMPHKSSLPSSTRSLLEEENDMEFSTDRKEGLSSVDNCENDAVFISSSSGGSNARLNECDSRPLDRDVSDCSGLSSEESYSDETPFSFPDIPMKSLQQLPLARILCGTQSLDDFSGVFEKDSIVASTDETKCKEVLSPWMQEKNSSHEFSQDQGTIESCALSSSKNFGSSLENSCLCFEQTSPVNSSSPSSVIRDSPLSPIQLASCNGSFPSPSLVQTNSLSPVEKVQSDVGTSSPEDLRATVETYANGLEPHDASISQPIVLQSMNESIFSLPQSRPPDQSEPYVDEDLDEEPLYANEKPFDERDFDRDTPKRIQDESTEDDKPVRRFGTLWRAQGTSISSKATNSSTSAFSATGSRLKRDDYQKNLHNRPTFNASVRATDVKSRRNDPIPMLLSMEWPDDSRYSLDSNSCEFDLSCRDSSVLTENANVCRVSKAYSRSRPWSASARNVQSTRKHSQGPSDGNDTSTDSDFDDDDDGDDDDDDGDGDDDNSSSCTSDVSDYQVDDVVARLTSRLSIREQRKIRQFGASTSKEKESLTKLGPEQESQSENRHLHGGRNSSSHTHDRSKTRRKESILSPWDDDDSVIAPIRRGDASKVDELISKADCESEDFVLQIPIFGYTTVRELILNLTRTSIQEKIVAFFFDSRSKKMFEVIQEVKNPLDFMEMYRLLSDVSDHDIIYPQKTSSSKDGSIVSNSSSMDRERLLLWKDRGFFSILLKRFLRNELGLPEEIDIRNCLSRLTQFCAPPRYRSLLDVFYSFLRGEFSFDAFRTFLRVFVVVKFCNLESRAYVSDLLQMQPDSALAHDILDPSNSYGFSMDSVTGRIRDSIRSISPSPGLGSSVPGGSSISTYSSSANIHDPVLRRLSAEGSGFSTISFEDMCFAVNATCEVPDQAFRHLQCRFISCGGFFRRKSIPGVQSSTLAATSSHPIGSDLVCLSDFWRELCCIITREFRA